jgi:hypothetical protein
LDAEINGKERYPAFIKFPKKTSQKNSKNGLPLFHLKILIDEKAKIPIRLILIAQIIFNKKYDINQ